MLDVAIVKKLFCIAMAYVCVLNTWITV